MQYIMLNSLISFSLPFSSIPFICLTDEHICGHRWTVHFLSVFYALAAVVAKGWPQKDGQRGRNKCKEINEPFGRNVRVTEAGNRGQQSRLHKY